MLLGLLSFVVTASAGSVLTLTWAFAVGVVSLLFVRLISQTGEPPSEIAAMLTAGTAVALGGGLKWFADSPGLGWPDAVAILVSQGASWGLDLLIGGGKRRCFICKLVIDERLPFACPRCKQVICARPSCWVARHYRCKSCDEREVILFPIDEQWWRTRFGPRVFEGSCSSCYKEARETDLRACGRCRWTMCRRCWDYHNGRCGRCEWILPDPPAALRPFLGTPEPRDPRRSDGGARRL